MAKKKKKTSVEMHAEHVSQMETHVKVITDAASTINEYRHSAGYEFDGNRINEVMQSIGQLTDLRADIDAAIEGVLQEMKVEILQLTRQQTATLKRAGIIKKRKRAKPADKKPADKKPTKKKSS